MAEETYINSKGRDFVLVEVAVPDMPDTPNRTLSEAEKGRLAHLYKTYAQLADLYYNQCHEPRDRERAAAFWNVHGPLTLQGNHTAWKNSRAMGDTLSKLRQSIGKLGGDHARVFTGPTRGATPRQRPARLAPPSIQPQPQSPQPTAYGFPEGPAAGGPPSNRTAPPRDLIHGPPARDQSSRDRVPTRRRSGSPRSLHQSPIAPDSGMQPYPQQSNLQPSFAPRATGMVSGIHGQHPTAPNPPPQQIHGRRGPYGYRPADNSFQYPQQTHHPELHQFQQPEHLRGPAHPLTMQSQHPHDSVQGSRPAFGDGIAATEGNLEDLVSSAGGAEFPLGTSFEAAMRDVRDWNAEMDQPADETLTDDQIRDNTLSHHRGNQ